jgi:hypothetical protein
MNSYENKQEQRRSRLMQKAATVTDEGKARVKRANEMAAVIPLGQPILLGHHSEGRDRRFRARITNNFRAGFDLLKQAEDLRHAAGAVGTGGVSADDPDGIEKLRHQLADRQRAQERMRTANALVRHNDRAGLANMGFSKSQIAELFAGDCAGRLGIPAYELTNNNAQIRRLQRRIAELERHSQRQDREEAGNGYTYREDTAENRVMFLFPGKPLEPIRALLKQHGFKFSPSRNNAWVRQLNQNGLWAAKAVREKLEALNAAAE